MASGYKYAVLGLLLTCTNLFAQLSVSNQGALISLKNGAFISIHGDYQSEINGLFDNEDSVFLFGDWINNAGNTGFNEPYEGTVVLIGDSQRIKGTDTTHFANLDLRGTGVKYGDLHVIVEDTLQLNDREFNMDVNTVEVTNSYLNAVKRSSGFVSSLVDGGIARHTSVTESYLFPVGSSLGTPRYRPVDITPNSAGNHVFKVRLANVDATLENYDRNVREPIICDINEYYYHRIFRLAGTQSADIRLNFDEATDGAFQNIAHWQRLPQWEDARPVTYLPGGAGIFSTLEIDSWNDFTYSPFALANSSANFDVNGLDEFCHADTIPFFVSEEFIGYEFFVNGISTQDGSSNTFIISTLQDGDTITVIGLDSTCIAYSNPFGVAVNPNPTPDAGDDTSVYIGASVTLEGSGGLYYLWSPDSSLDCSTCQFPLATVFETTPYSLEATNEFGCKGRDTVLIIVDEKTDPRQVLFIPNAITPNGDGLNDTWNILNLDLYVNEVIIINRWGDHIFSASPYLNTWDGTFKGKPVPDGTYYYIIKLNDIEEVINGPLTVVR